MTSNGKRRPPRPAIQMIAPAAEPAQAAAIAAALERFLHDTTPVPAPPVQRTSRWARTALAEGAFLDGPDAWGDPQPWGAWPRG